MKNTYTIHRTNGDGYVEIYRTGGRVARIRMAGFLESRYYYEIEGVTRRGEDRWAGSFHGALAKIFAVLEKST